MLESSSVAHHDLQPPPRREQAKGHSSLKTSSTIIVPYVRAQQIDGPGLKATRVSMRNRKNLNTVKIVEDDYEDENEPFKLYPVASSLKIGEMMEDGRDDLKKKRCKTSEMKRRMLQPNISSNFKRYNQQFLGSKECQTNSEGEFVPMINNKSEYL